MARSKSRPRLLKPVDERDSWWGNLDGWKQHLICLALLLLASLTFFAPIHFGGLAVVGGDTVQWRGMANRVYDVASETGDRPLWNPNAFSGMPAYMIAYAQEVPQINGLFQLIRKVLWPSSHFLVLFAGMYLLGFLLTRNKIAGVLGALAYGFTTYLPIILAAGHNTKFIALAFAPWLVLTFAYALRKPGPLSSLLFAAVFAANLHADHPQITYYVAFMLGIWWLVELVQAGRTGGWKSFGKSTAALAAGAVLGIMMVAQPYLINFEYKEFTIRGAAAAAAGSEGGGMDLSYAFNWSQGWGELVTLLIPDAYGGSQFYWGPKPFTGGPHYVGGIVIALALFALLRSRRKEVIALGIAAVLMTLFSLGEHFMVLNKPMYDYFPFFDAFRVPETWLAIVALALAILATLGAFLLTAPEEREQRTSNTRSAYVAFGAVGAFTLLLLFGGESFFDFGKPNEREQVMRQVVTQVQRTQPAVDLSNPRVQRELQQRVAGYLAQMEENRIEAFNSDAMRTLIFLVLAGALVVAYRRERVPGYVALFGLAALVLVDLWGVDRRYFGEEQLSEVQTAEEKIPEYGFDTYLVQQREQVGGYGRFRVLSLASGQPFTSSRASYFHESLGGYHGAKLRIYQDFIDYLYRDEQGLPRETMLDLLNTRYVVAGGRLPGPDYRVAYQDQRTGLLVLENTDVLPRAFIPERVEVVGSATETLDRMRAPGFDPAEVAFVREPLPVESVPVDSASTPVVQLVEHGPESMEWSVTTDAPRLLVVSEIYYPAGWTAYVDGEEVPIAQTDHFLRGVMVPAGEHSVTMEFAPQTHETSVLVTWLGTIVVYGGILLMLGLGFMRRRKERPEVQQPEGAIAE